MTSVLIMGNQAFIGHVGDSRAYLLRQDQIVPSHDGSQPCGRAGAVRAMTEAQARVSQYRNIITRSIGVDAEVEVDLYYVALEQGDLLLLCMTASMVWLPMKRSLTSCGGHYTEQCPKMLIELACAHGGEDNITALCVYIDGESEVSPAAKKRR